MRDYYRIGEISALYGIGVDSLRYYEEIGLLCPKRADNGYRMYSITDIWKLNIIRELRGLGFSMEEIRRHLGHYDLKDTLALFESEIGRIDRQMEELGRLKRNLAERIRQIERNRDCEENGIIRKKTLPERRVLILTENVTRDEDVDFLLKKLQKRHEDTLYLIGNGCLGGMMPAERIREGRYGFYTSVFYESGAGEKFDCVIPGGTYYCVIYKGGYEQTIPYLSAMMEEARRAGEKIDGDPIELWRIHNHETGRQEEYVTEVQLKVCPDGGAGSGVPEGS